MDDKILIQDLAEQLAEAEGLQKNEAQAFIRTFFDTITKGLENDKYVKIKGLGTFKLVEVDSRESINVNTGERFMIDGHAKISFTPDNVLKELVNKPFAQFETVVLSDEVTEEELEAVNRKFEGDNAAEESATEEPVMAVAEKVEEKSPETPVAEEMTVMAQIVPEEPEIQAEPEKQEQPAISNEPVLVKLVEPVNVNVSSEQTEQLAESEPVAKNNHFRNIWIVLCMVALLLGYVLGYFNVFSPKNSYRPTIIHDTVFVQKVIHDTVKVEKVVPNELIKSESTTDGQKEASNQSSSKSNPAEVEASNYPQLKGGAYLIVGTKETYKLKDGETIRIIAERYYGSREMAAYIATYNEIADPNKVAAGTLLKIPELKRKGK